MGPIFQVVFMCHSVLSSLFFIHPCGDELDCVSGAEDFQILVVLIVIEHQRSACNLMDFF